MKIINMIILRDNRKILTLLGFEYSIIYYQLNIYKKNNFF